MSARVDPWTYAEPVEAPQRPDGRRGEAWQRTSGGRTTSRQPRPIGRVSTVIAEQPWFRYGNREQRQRVVQAAQDARQRAHDRKARVKAHPDLAERLVRSLGYSRFDQWSGHVPPARKQGWDKDNWLPNDCPIRTELIAILHLVVEREQAASASCSPEQDADD